MDTICNGIRSNGTRCTKPNKPGTGDGTKCGIHHNAILKYGPHTNARRELGFLNRKEIADYNNNHNNIRDAQIQQGINNDTIWLLNANHAADMRLMRARHTRLQTDLVIQQREEIRRTGVDPDTAARERDVIERRARRERIMIHRNRIIDARHQALQQPQPQAPRIAPQERQLAEFAADPQNVHTVEAVTHTKRIVARVREIPVPEGYRWNTHIVSKTIGEIIAECQLNAHAAAQMFNQYVSPVAIYDIEEGIYGKVLDSVWQYVKASPDKEDLCKILKNEMTDNIGMCAQGNLSRICNILAGYMEGVGPQESLSERLGRVLPPLLQIEDAAERIRQACVILAENKVSANEWDTWIEPLMDEEQIEFYELIREQFNTINNIIT